MAGKTAVWSSRHKALRDMLSKPDSFDEAIQLCLGQHAMVHASEMSQSDVITFEDELWNGLDEAAFRARPTVEDETIAWNMWHTTRIEDITMNVLVAGETQVINTDNWPGRMAVKIRDTGNAMTGDEIIDFSSEIVMRDLQKYRMAVGRRTREIIQGFRPADLKRKMEPSRLQRVIDEGAVLNVDGARWLIDFWGRKNVAGILLMPVTRHHLVHINESMRIKKKCQSSKR